jgi:EAL domain-containing protein (putative c-di-GMP-specific phosphodiesterase class I)
MAHSLGMQTVAEGVETAAQLDALKKLGCDQVQGYLFSKPLSASEFNTFVVAHEPLLSPSAQRAVNAI